MKMFSVYSLKLVLQANVKGIKICGITTNKFNGLHQTSIKGY
jgi:hypothetical protein